MSLRIRFAAALLCSVAGTATAQNLFAQSQQSSIVRSGPANVPQKGVVEQLPPGQMSGGPSQPYYPSDSTEGGDMQGGGSAGCDEGYCNGPYCDQNCCGQNCCPQTSGCCDGGCCGLAGGRFYFTADYLNVRASFSEATAKVVEDLNAGTDTFVPLNFGFESSYRFGGGYRLNCCGEEIRFLYTRMTSSAEDTAQNGDLVPIEASPPPGGQTNIHASVDSNTYDIEWAKTIPLGGCCNSCGSCCDDCQSGCGSACCGHCCPAWDITWSGGFRWGDVDWSRRFAANDANAFTVTDARSDMNFHGGGLRTGLEGRRYFGKDGWLSLYAKGDLSLLFGRINLVTHRDTFDPSTPGTPTTTNTQTFTNQQIIPVTELEAGVTGQVSCHLSLTGGYLMSAWHDLGFRDQDQLNTLLPISYDDANILGFDGFFARAEFSY
jgi:hypothetical protein